MDVECPQFRKIDDLLRQNVTVGNYDGDVRLELVELLRKLGGASVLRLEKRDLLLESDLLYRREDYLARPPLRFVGLRDDADDIEPLPDERAQRGRCEFRRTPKDNAHYISVSFS